MMKLNCKGQNTVEYALLIAAITAALVAGQYFVKRATEGRIKDSAGSMGDQWSFDKGSYTKQINSSSDTTSTTLPSGGQSTQIGSQYQKEDLDVRLDKATTLWEQ